MAFCKYCGRQLNEGEVCGCPGSVQEMNMAANRQVNNEYADNSYVNNGQINNHAAQQNQFNTEQMQQYVAQGKVVASNAWKKLLEIFKAPASAGREYVSNSDKTVSAVLIVVQAILSGLFGLVITSKINSYIGLLYSFFSSDEMKISGVKGFLLTIIFSVLFSAIYCLLIFAGAKIAKADVDLQMALAVTSVRSAAVIPFIVIGIIIAFINPIYGFSVFYLGNILAIYYVYASLTGIINEDKLCYVMTGVTIVFMFATGYIMSKGVVAYFPETMKNAGSLTDVLEDLF